MQTSPKTLKVAIFQEVYNGLKSKKLHILLYKIAQYLREDCTSMGEMYKLLYILSELILDYAP